MQVHTYQGTKKMVKSVKTSQSLNIGYTTYIHAVNPYIKILSKKDVEEVKQG